MLMLEISTCIWLYLNPNCSEVIFNVSISIIQKISNHLGNIYALKYIKYKAKEQHEEDGSHPRNHDFVSILYWLAFRLDHFVFDIIYGYLHLYNSNSQWDILYPRLVIISVIHTYASNINCPYRWFMWMRLDFNLIVFPLIYQNTNCNLGGSVFSSNNCIDSFVSMFWERGATFVMNWASSIFCKILDLQNCKPAQLSYAAKLILLQIVQLLTIWIRFWNNTLWCIHPLDLKKTTSLCSPI